MAAHGRAGRRANPRYHPPMTCACESEYSFPCQFTGETELFPFNGKQWCRFHLPLKDLEGNQSDKWLGINGWEPDGGVELGAFRSKLVEQLSAASHATPRGNRREADCKFVAFPHGFDFRNLRQPLNVNFTGASFGHWVFFDNQNFGIAIFSHAIFWSGTSFTGTTFRSVADFFCTKFWDIADFKCSTFIDRTEFSDARFEGSAHFDGATFQSSANFIDATFENKAGFDGATFGGVTHFDDAKLGDRTSFSGAKFQGEATFSVRDVDKANPKFQRINFSKAEFEGPCSFENRKFTANASFNDAEFHDLAKFHGCAFHQGMSFHETKFLKTKGGNDDATEALERSYRTLKLEMEKLRARNEEADFFALEMECRRQRGSVPRFERFAATVYKIFSDYGRSIARPLICLGFLVGYGFAYFYHLAQAKSFHAPGDVLRFTMEQIALPFSIWSNRHAPDPWVAHYLKEDPWLLYAPATVMTLTAIGLLTLFLLALRRRFKMD